MDPSKKSFGQGWGKEFLLKLRQDLLELEIYTPEQFDEMLAASEQRDATEEQESEKVKKKGMQNLPTELEQSLLTVLDLGANSESSFESQDTVPERGFSLKAVVNSEDSVDSTFLASSTATTNTSKTLKMKSGTNKELHSPEKTDNTVSK